MEQHEFQAEVKQLLDLMIHSLYSHKDIFLRELISNGSDALDRLRFEGLTHPEWMPAVEAQIGLDVDKTRRTLTVHDNGIGMTKDEMIQNLGTIARSGTQEFLRLLKERKDQGLPPEMIGQFGVGFYSSFMVADRIVVVSRRAGEPHATRWESHGAGAFTVEETERESSGTSVTVHLKPVDEEDGIRDYTDEWVLREIVKKYSDFVAYPIRLPVERREIEKGADGKPKPGAKEKIVRSEETLNSMKAVWTRPKSEVSEAEYKEFYKHLSHDFSDPLETIVARMEGHFEANVLLFLPAHQSWDVLLHGEKRHGIQLYVKRVFIMEECRELIPDCLRFVRGVVDSESLSLNVSREILQQDRQIRAIRAFVVRKVLDALKGVLQTDRDRYATFWKEFGAILKQGLYGWEENERKDALLHLVLSASSQSGDGFTTLAEYVTRMKPGQDAIYYLTGLTRESVAQSPHLEAFREKEYEVLYLTDPVDELWTQAELEFEGHKFQSVGKGEVELGSKEEKKEEEERQETAGSYKAVLDGLREILADDVKEVRLSTRLVASPACLVSEEKNYSPQVDELMRRMGQKVERKKRILEVNPKHELLVKLRSCFEKDPKAPDLRNYARLLYGQALLAEGSQLPDAASYGRLIAKLMTKAL
ncbi:MAG: molecular chaperone HtpG [candidate division NC10 bacterium]